MRTKKTGANFAFVLSLLACSLTANLAIAQTDGNARQALRVVEAGPFRINVHCDDEDVVSKAQRVGELTWQIASKFYACELPKEKLEANLYRDLEGYAAADEKLTGGARKKNQAFAHLDTLSAHVAMQPPVSDELLRMVGLPKQSARLFAHEMAHLVRFSRMPNTVRNHPYWLIDGAASHIDRQVITELGFIEGGAMSDPNFATYASHGKKLLSEDKLPTVEQLLDDVKLEVGFYQRYSVRWIFMNMLVVKHGPRFDAFMKDLPRIGGGRGYAQRAKELLLKILGVDVETLDKDFRDHVRNLQPLWVEEIRSLETGGDAWHQISFPNSTATCWRQAPLGDSFTLSLTATIQKAGRNQLNIRVGQPASFTQFSITAGFGLNVFEFSDKEWNTKLGKEIKGLKIGEPMKLVVSHDHERELTMVKLNGETIFEGKVNLEADNLFALGAQRGSAVTWQDFEVK